MIDRRLLIATSNAGKLEEFRALLPPELELLSLADVDVDLPEETGETFTENAILKAVSAAQASGLPTLADDSGLEVDALGGRPGVRSARFAGQPTDDRRNYERVLAELGDLPRSARSARFRCVVAFSTPDGPVTTAEGACEGVIVPPRGSHGFGYDPIVELPDGRTVAELEPAEKNRRSHRANAIEQIHPALEQHFSL